MNCFYRCTSVTGDGRESHVVYASKRGRRRRESERSSGEGAREAGARVESARGKRERKMSSSLCSNRRTFA